jgi:hypothetical protein
MVRVPFYHIGAFMLASSHEGADRLSCAGSNRVHTSCVDDDDLWHGRTDDLTVGD